MMQIITVTSLHFACPYSTDKLKTNIQCNSKKTLQHQQWCSTISVYTSSERYGGATH